jgi:chaperone required for assembly of F1-ATPase
VLGLALADGALTPLAALEASALDELYQQARWGKDAEAADRRARLLREIEHAFRFMELCRNDPGRHTGAPRVWGGHA